MLEKSEKDVNSGNLRSSEVHIHNGENQRIRVMTVSQTNKDEVHIEIIEDVEIRPRSMYRS
jgi:hypothetical protein